MPIEQRPDFQSNACFVINAHQNLAKSPNKTVRRFDNETPYSIHPLWCATMIAAEVSLPESLRTEGTFTLLYHDILEDTTADIPSNLPPDIRKSIEDMTFMGGMSQEMIEIWGKEPKIRLFKLYDKVSNLLDSAWMTPERRRIYVEHTRKLIEDVEKNFGPLNIIKIAKTIVE